MNGFRSSIRWCAPVFVLILLLLTTEVARGASFTSPSWQLVSVPNPGTQYNDLAAVAASSSTDVWAVGSYSNNFGDVPGYSLIEHFNGKAWRTISSPLVGTSDGLAGVVAISASNAWAVGSSSKGTLIEHWNGTTWSVVTSPNTHSSVSYLTAVTADSANDIWAVGTSYPQQNGPAQTLVEHWNGTSWSIVPSPTNSYVYLASVAAVSPSDVWAVGNIQKSSVQNTFTMHWNGTSWSVVPGPNASPLGSRLNSVTAVSSNDVWAVGNFVNYTNDKNVNQTLIEQWNGTSWSIITSPNIGRSNNILTAVSAISANNIWTDGDYVKVPTAAYQTETQHWNGTSWSVVSSPNVANAHLNELQGLTAINTQDVWTVGFYEKGLGGSDEALTENYCC